MADSSVRAERDRPIVMLVEGEEQFVYLLQRYAEKSGCRFVSARLEDEALELARRERPAVILVDVVQAETGGRDVLRALKADPDTGAIPVVMCSGWDEGVPFWRGLGAQDYVQKPVSYERFVAALQGVGVKLRE